MATGRRSFLTGLAATALCPRMTWARAGNPAFLAAARRPDGAFSLCGLTADGQIAFAMPLPGRGHAAAAHPERPQAVAFARRPGRFALVLDCAAGAVTAHLNAPKGRHFYGHGAFTLDGRYLFTTENDYDAARGVVGVWHADAGYRRMGEFSSAGIGPHDIRLLPNGAALVVANGGIETHPDSGRSKLNLATMRPNLSLLKLDGELIEQHETPRGLGRNSLRHLAVGAQGQIAVACQWQGDPIDPPPLLGVLRPGQGLQFLAGQGGLERQMQGYAGSIAIRDNEGSIALTGPRGGVAAIFRATGQHAETRHHADVCGVAPAGGGFAFTTGGGDVILPGGSARHNLQWDNHLIPVRPI